MDSINLSIVIISYNTKEITNHCLDSIYKSLEDKNIKYEIIVVDNASTDGSLSMLQAVKKNHPTLHIIESQENLGFAKANNLAVKSAKGEYLLFLNSDIIVLDRAITKLFNKFNSDTSIHFLGGKLLNRDMTPQASCGPSYSLINIFIALFLRGDYWGITRSSPNKFKETNWISGACILTRKLYFEKLGGFDEKIFMYMDEIDLLHRAKKSGFKIFFYPDARFIHLGSASSRGRTYPIIQVYSGLLYFYKKHYSRTSLLFLKIMLKLKALVGIILGRFFNSQYLKETYEKAYKIT